MDLINYYRLRKEATRAKAMGRLTNALNMLPSRGFSELGMAGQAQARRMAANTKATSGYYHDMVAALKNRQAASLKRAQAAVQANPFSSSAIDRLSLVSNPNTAPGAGMLQRATALRDKFGNASQLIDQGLGTGKLNIARDAMSSLQNNSNTFGASLLGKYPVR